MSTVVRGPMPPRAALIFSIVCAALALLFSVVMAVKVYRWRRALNVYQPSTCSVTSHEVKPHTHHTGVVEYEGIVHLKLVHSGVTYEKRDELGMWQTEERAAAYMTAHYPVAQPTPCYFDPEAPAQFVLTRDEDGDVGLIVLPIFFDAIAALMVGFTIRRYRRWRAGLGT